MSLKHFHLFFIACSIGLMVFLLTWTRGQAAAGQPWPVFAGFAWAGAVASVAYLAWFVRRYQTLR